MCSLSILSIVKERILMVCCLLVFLVSKYDLLHCKYVTVCKFKKFSATWILREIDFSKSNFCVPLKVSKYVSEAKIPWHRFHVKPNRQKNSQISTLCLYIAFWRSSKWIPLLLVETCYPQKLTGKVLLKISNIRWIYPSNLGTAIFSYHILPFYFKNPKCH